MRDKNGDLVITREKGQRIVHAGVIEISDEDISEYLKEDPRKITDNTLREISEIVVETLNENLKDALVDAFEFVMSERKINARYE